MKYPEGSNGTTQLRIDADNYIPRLYKLCETIHQYGTKIAIQLNHAAGMCHGKSYWNTTCFCEVQLLIKQEGAIPHALTVRRNL